MYHRVVLYRFLIVARANHYIRRILRYEADLRWYPATKKSNVLKTTEGETAASAKGGGQRSFSSRVETLGFLMWNARHYNLPGFEAYHAHVVPRQRCLALLWKTPTRGMGKRACQRR